MAFQDIQTTGQGAEVEATAKSSLQGWLLEWGDWMSLWQQGRLDAPGSVALNGLLNWKRTLPTGSFQELHELLDQLLRENSSPSERQAVLQMLKSWQRSLLRLNNRAQAARV